MKKFKKGIFLLIVLFTGITSVSAATANITVSSSSKSVVVGGTFKVTTKVSSKELGAWEYCISYDSSSLKLEGSSANSGNCVKAGVVGQTGQTETWTFKALKSGTSKVSVRSYAVYSIETEDQMSTSVGSVSITARTQAEIEASYSKNNYLKSLGVDGYSLSPEFNKETKEYNVDVPSEVTKINITASPEDGKSSIKGIGEFEVVEGTNAFEIIVTAQNGNTNTYKINVNVEDKNPIEVKYDGNTYNIVKRASLLTKPEGFTDTTITINDISVPAIKNEVTNVTLVGLKDKDGNIYLFEYNDGKYSRYYEFKFNQLTINIIEMDKKLLPEGYKKYSISLKDETIDGYKLNEDSNYALVYGVDVSTGEKALFQIDTKNNTVQEFNSELIKKTKEDNKKTLLIFAVAGGIIFLEFLIILAYKGKVKRILNKIKNEKIEKTKKEAIKKSREESIDKKIPDNMNEKTIEINVNKKKSKK